MAIRRRLDGFFFTVLARIIRDKALQAADRDRLTLNAAYAFLLALCFLRAHAAADSGQRRGFLDFGRSFEEFALGDKRDKFRDLYLHWTARDTGLMLAVQATLRFLDRHFRCVAECDLIKVLVADVGVLLRHGHFFRIHVRHLT